MTDDTTRIGSRTVTADAVATFAALTGDYSRIHVDHALGASAPGGRGFAHGLLSASWALGALTLYAPERLGCGAPGAWLSSFEVRFHEVVRFGDTLALQWHDAEAGTRAPGTRVSDGSEEGTGFALLNQDGRTVTSGSVGVHERGRTGDSADVDAAPEAWPGGAYVRPEQQTAMTGEDIVAVGPRGGSRVRSVTETDVVNFATFTGELNPLYLDAVFAARSPFRERIAPPMLCFCLGFGVWLREFLRLPMSGDESSAGHLGDRWRVVAPVHIGDTLEVRYQPLSLRRTRSQPTRGVATFGLQLLNQREQVVQVGEVDMMLPMREPPMPEPE